MDAEFNALLAQAKFKDARDSQSQDDRLQRARGVQAKVPGKCIPPHLLDQWTKLLSVPETEDQGWMLERSYYTPGAGFDIYLQIVRAMLPFGLEIKQLFDQDTAQSPKYQHFWHLLHHDFGHDDSADMLVRGLMLYVWDEMQREPKNGGPTTLTGLLQGGLTRDLLFYRLEMALISPVITMHTSDGKQDEENLITMAKRDGFFPQVASLLTDLVWDGEHTISEYLNQELTSESDLKDHLPAEFVPADCVKMQAFFNFPLFLNVYYSTVDATKPKRTIEDIRRFKVRGLSFDGEVEKSYSLFAIIDLDQQRIRFYHGDSSYYTTKQLPSREDGLWKFGDRGKRFMIVFASDRQEKPPEVKVNVPVFVFMNDEEEEEEDE